MAQAAKKATNLSINSDLLAKAKELQINLSATLESALTEAISRKQQDQWRIDNQAAIEAYNHTVEEGGVFSDGVRGF